MRVLSRGRDRGRRPAARAARSIARGHRVTATTRTSRPSAAALRALGAEPVVLDGLDAAAVGEAVGRAEPDVIVHQMTALAGDGLGPAEVRPLFRHYERKPNPRQN